MSVPVSPSQSLAAGQTIQARYEGLGGYVAPAWRPPERARALIIGFPKDGKSAFLQSHPGNYILNFDLSPTVTGTARAAMFPQVNEEGQPVLRMGKTGPLTYSIMLDEIATLKRLAVEGKPRPQTVTIDCLNSWMRLARAWIVDNAVALNLWSADRQKPSGWKDLLGKAAYDYLYDHVVTVINDLFNHGYGVYVVTQVVNTVMQVGDDRNTIKPDIVGFTDKFWMRVCDLFDFVGIVAKETVTSQKKVTQEVVVAGKTITRDNYVTTQSVRVVIADSHPDMDGIAGSRVAFGRVELPLTDGWASFSAAYNAAVKPS